MLTLVVVPATGCSAAPTDPPWLLRPDAGKTTADGPLGDPPPDRRLCEGAARAGQDGQEHNAAEWFHGISRHFEVIAQFAHGGHQLALLGRGKRRQLPRLGALGARQRPGE